MAEFINPFDFKHIFLDIFVGNHELFMFIFVIIYSYAAGKFNFPNSIYLLVLTIGMLLFAAFFGLSIYMLILLVLGFIIFKAIAKVVT